MHYNCVKFHKNSISNLVGIALTRYMPSPFRESISWIISPFKFWTATIFLLAHLQVVYYKCAKCHKNPIGCLGGVALTRYMDDGQANGRTGWFLYTLPKTLFAGGIIKSRTFSRLWHGFYLLWLTKRNITHKIPGCLISLPDCDKTSEKRKRKSVVFGIIVYLNKFNIKF